MAGSFVWWRGGKFNQTSIASLVRAEKLAGVTFRVMQGGYNRGGVAASAGTHDGGGVVDISVAGWARSRMDSVCVALRKCGWAAWVRTPAQGFSWHIHAVRIGDSSASWGAKAQVVAYRLGRDGLARNRADTEPRPGYVSWAGSRYNPANAPAKPVKPKPLTISGKTYPDIGSVSVHYLNASRTKKAFSRHTYVLQCWLDRLGYHAHGAEDGRWDAGTQADLDAFRWDQRKTLGITTKDGAGGPAGLASLALLRTKAGSSRRVRKEK